jgi:RNA polymerase sigma-70 factor (ECF subfamily)
MARAKRGDSRAFGEVYERYVDDVYAYVRTRVGDPRLAEDLTQDTFVNAFRGVGRFHWQGAVKPWLLRIAHNRVANHYRTVGRRPQVADEPIEDAEGQPVAFRDHGADPGDDAERILRLDEVARALEHLTDLERQVIALRFGQEMTVAEAAEVMGRSEHSVRSLQYRAVQRFREHVRSEDGAS